MVQQDMETVFLKIFGNDPLLWDAYLSICINAENQSLVKTDEMETSERKITHQVISKIEEFKNRDIQDLMENDANIAKYSFFMRAKAYHEMKTKDLI